MPHIHELIDFTVGVYVVFEDTVLLRKHDKYGLWLGVGGHIELDEDPIEAAVRETKEEVGLDVEIIDTREYKEGGEIIPPMSLNRHAISDSHTHVNLQYAARASSNVVIPENKTDEWRWCTREELQSWNEVDGATKFGALRALELASNNTTHV